MVSSIGSDVQEQGEIGAINLRISGADRFDCGADGDEPAGAACWRGLWARLAGAANGLYAQRPKAAAAASALCLTQQLPESNSGTVTEIGYRSSQYLGEAFHSPVDFFPPDDERRRNSDDALVRLLAEHAEFH